MATLNDGAQRVDWIVTENDALTRTFDILDENDDVITDPEGDGWEFFAQVRDRQGGEVLGDLTFSFDGQYVTQALPELATGTYWWEKETTAPGEGKRTTEAGVLIVNVDSAVEE